MAQLQVEADTCPGCRQPLSETTQPGAEGSYEVPPPTRCHSCTALHKGQEPYEKAPPGLMFETIRRR